MRRHNDEKENRPESAETLRQQLLEAKLRLALLEYQQKEDAAQQRRRDALPEDAPEKAAEAAFFARTEGKMIRLIRAKSKNKEKAAKHGRLSRFLSAAAIFVLVLLLGFGSALAFSPALRVQLMRMLYQVTPQYTEIRFLPDPNKTLEIPAEWNGLYYPSYIPEGYRMEGARSNSFLARVAYSGSAEKYILFTEYNLDVETNLNTEGFTIEEIEINGFKGILAYKEGKTNMLWPCSDKYFVLHITENRDVAMKIAQSVVRIK